MLIRGRSVVFQHPFRVPVTRRDAFRWCRSATTRSSHGIRFLRLAQPPANLRDASGILSGPLGAISRKYVYRMRVPFAFSLQRASGHARVTTVKGFSSPFVPSQRANRLGVGTRARLRGASYARLRLGRSAPPCPSPNCEAIWLSKDLRNLQKLLDERSARRFNPDKAV